MGKFEVGDKVEVILSGYGCDPEDKGRLVVITEVGDYCGYDGYKVSPPIGNTLSGVYGGYIGEKSFRFVSPDYPNPPHKHAEVIKAWADGADIEAREVLGWQTLVSPCPAWREDISYRIKPATSPAEKERDEIKAEMEKLTKRLEALEVK
jgi:hypothetical protein